MEDIKLDLFSELLSLDGKYAATNVELVSGGTVYTLEKSANVSFVLSGGVPMSGEDSVTYTLYEGEIKRRVFFTAEEAISYVKERFAVNGKVTVARIEDFDSFARFKADAEFRHWNMAQLLEYYADCDEFSLTAYYNGGEDERHPHGIYKLDKKTGENALELIRFEQRDLCRFFYETANKGKEDAQPFDDLFAEISAEVEELYSSVAQRPLDVAAMYADGKMKRKGGDREVQMIYNSAGFLQRCKEDIDAQCANTLTRPVACEFDGAPLAALKPYLSRVLVTYCWHCTISDRLGKVFFIKLNDVTKKWLLSFEDDYGVAATGLFDPAFYKDGECRFSSNTSEKTHSDYTEN